MSYINHRIFIFYIVSTLTFHIIITSFWLEWSGFTFSALGFLYFIVVQGIAFQLSLSTADILFSIFLPFKKLNKLDSLLNTPRVAVLYTVCDDLFVNCLCTLKDLNYSNYQVFILDDSELTKTKEIIDKIAKQNGFVVVRRNNRRGFKAGNLNNWLRIHAQDYPYFIIADSDSKFPSSFITEMLTYAEHPFNKPIVGFQSKNLFWNIQHRYPRIMKIAQPISYFFIERLSQWDLTYSCLGHNSLYRTKEVCEVGGFPEEFVAEDFALQLRLAKSSYCCRVVDVISYEAHPEILRNVRRRMQRWASQTLQLLQHSAKGVPPSLIVASIRSSFHYCVWPFYLLGLIVLFLSAIITQESNSLSISDSFLIGTKLLIHPVALLLIGIFLFQVFIRMCVSIKLKIGLASYLIHCFYSMVEGFYLIMPISYRIISHLFFAKVEFNPTYKILTNKKERYKEIFWWAVFIGIWLFVVTTVIILPGILIPNAFWLVPALLSPAILWQFNTQKG